MEGNMRENATPNEKKVTFSNAKMKEILVQMT
jgi:hypothetical protein